MDDVDGFFSVPRSYSSNHDHDIPPPIDPNSFSQFGGFEFESDRKSFSPTKLDSLLKTRGSQSSLDSLEYELLPFHSGLSETSPGTIV